MSLGTELAGAKNLVIIQSFEALSNGLGGIIGPPVASKLLFRFLIISVCLL